MLGLSQACHTTFIYIYGEWPSFIFVYSACVRIQTSHYNAPSSEKENSIRVIQISPYIPNHLPFFVKEMSQSM